ncbi:MAG: hypothetical protein J6Q51_04620 [Clostridia bacterium]|nr:hypothetical protein [Clostridia bacterium]
MDNLETNIKQLRMTVEELEKRIKAISSQVTVNTQVTATKACLEEIKSLLLQFQDSYNEHLNYCFLQESEHTKEYNEFKQNTNDRLENVASTASFSAVKVEEIQTELNSLLQQINRLEQLCISTENIANNTEIKCNDLEYKVDGYELTIQELQSNTMSALNQCESLFNKVLNTEQQIDEINQTVSNLQTQVSQNKTDINSTANDVSFVQSSVNNLDQQVQSLTQTVQSAQTVFSQLKPVIEQNQSNVSVLQSTTSTLSTNVKDLSSRVVDLENNTSSGGGASCDLNFDFYNLQNNQFNFSGEYYSPYFYVTCNKNSVVDLEITLTGEVLDLLGGTDLFVNLTVNDDEVYTQQVGLHKEGEFKFSFCFPIISNKTANKCRLSFTRDMASTYINTLSIKALGKNVCLHCADKNFNIFCFNQQYYIVGRNQNRFIFYGTCNKDEFDINNINLEQMPINSAVNNVIMPMLFPSTSIVVTLTSNGNNQFMYICPEIQDTVFYGPANSTSGGYSTSLTQVSKSSMCIDVVPYGKSYGGVTQLFIDTDTAVHIIYSKLFGMKTDTPVKLNGEAVTNCIYGTLVKNNNLNFGDSVPSQIAGLVLTTTDGINYFYPSEASTYNIELAKGKNATAYLQPDESINVYINQGTTVCKFVLCKNADGVYEINDTQTTTYYGYTRIEEAYNDMVFAYKYDKLLYKHFSEL